MIKKMPMWLKVTCFFFIAIFLIFDFWYLYLLNNAPDQTVLTTVNVGTLNGVEDESLKDIVKVKYFANKDNSGLELLDFQLNYLTNEKTNDVISVGIQLIGTKDKPIKSYLNPRNEWSWHWFPLGFLIDRVIYEADFDAETYTYAMYNGLSYTSTSNIDVNSCFLITLDDESFLMKFRGRQTEEQITNEKGNEVYKSYAKYDINYLVYKMFNAISGSQIPYGTKGTYKFQFDENIFEYSKGTNPNAFESIDKQNALKVTQKIISNYSINIEVVERGAITAQDSLFGSIKKQANFNLTNNVDIYNYHTKFQIVDLTEKNFDYYQVGYNLFNLQLNETTKKQLALQKDAKLNILINLDALKAKNINVNSYIQDDYLKENKIYKLQTSETNSTGEIVYKEVTL